MNRPFLELESIAAAFAVSPETRPQVLSIAPTKTVFTEIGPVEIEVPATTPCAAPRNANRRNREFSVENRRPRRQFAYALADSAPTPGDTRR
jgi:hypothetical protein